MFVSGVPPSSHLPVNLFHKKKKRKKKKRCYFVNSILITQGSIFESYGFLSYFGVLKDAPGEREVAIFRAPESGQFLGQKFRLPRSVQFYATVDAPSDRDRGIRCY